MVRSAGNRLRLQFSGRHFFGDFLVAVDKKVTRHQAKGKTSNEKEAQRRPFNLDNLNTGNKKGRL
jgi:hypothetical protein